MKCNCCWNTIATSCYVTKCSHVFCKEDAEKYWSQEMICPACEKPLNQRDIRKVDLETGLEEKTFSLCGYPPEVVLDTMRNAMKFWENQKDLESRYQQYLNKETLNKAQQMERTYHEELVEMNSRISVMAKRLQTADHEQEQTKKEYSELQDKYQDKVREKAKLEELYNSLKRKYDQTLREGISSRVAPIVDDSSKVVSNTSLFQAERTSSLLGSNMNKENFQPTLQLKPTGNMLQKNSASPSFLNRKSPSFLKAGSGSVNSVSNNNGSFSSLGNNPLSVKTGLNINRSDSSSGATTLGTKFNMLNANQRLLFTPLKRPRPSSPLLQRQLQLNGSGG